MYNKEIIHKQCVEAIVKEGLTFFADLSLYVEPTLSTLYEWKFEQSEDIKNALSKNKLDSKRKMRRKWESSDNATLQLAAYKLLADKEEIDALTMNKVDTSGSLSITWNEERTYEHK